MTVSGRELELGNRLRLDRRRQIVGLDDEPRGNRQVKNDHRRRLPAVVHNSRRGVQDIVHGQGRAVVIQADGQGLSSPGSLVVAGLFLLRPVVAEHDLVGGIGAFPIFKGEPVNATGDAVREVELLEDIRLIGRDIDLAHEPVVELHRDPPRALTAQGLAGSGQKSLEGQDGRLGRLPGA